MSAGKALLQFGRSGVLRPYLNSPADHPIQTSPYQVALEDVVSVFATSLPRITLLEGLLQWRKDLRAAGCASGFQWLDGSFIEDLRSESREPADIDVVAFTHVPEPEEDWVRAHPTLWDRARAKARYGLDLFFLNLDRASHPAFVKQAAYLQGLFSHRRVSEEWKGFVWVDFPGDDKAARRRLTKLRTSIGEDEGALGKPDGR